ncbi:MAG: hypothetical protein V9H69_24425 [Anaerolineae bacterium]
MQRILSIVMLMALLLLVAACGGKDEATATPTSAGTATEQQPGQAAATHTPAPAAATSAPADDEQALSEEQLTALEALDSYRQMVVYTSKGVDMDGNPIDDRAEIITEYTRDPLARRMVMSFLDNIDPAASQDNLEVYQIGADIYMDGGEDVGWLRLSSEESPFASAEIAMLTGGGIFSDLDQMQRVRPDKKINGINSRHYQYDETVLSKIFGEEMANVTGSGDIWVAKEGGYLTKYLLTVDVKEGSGGVFDPNMATGVFTMEFELKDVNQDFTIDVPEEAMSGVSLTGFDGPFPMPEDGTVQVASAGFTIIHSALSMEDTIAFYEEALADLGWTKDEADSMNMGEMASLVFAKDDTKLTLLITFDSSTNLTQVMASAE